MSAPGREARCFLQLLKSFIWAAGAATRMLGAGHLSRWGNVSYQLLVLWSFLIISTIHRGLLPSLLFLWLLSGLAAWSCTEVPPPPRLEENPTFVLSFGLWTEPWAVDIFGVWMQIKGLTMQIHRGAGLWIKNNTPLAGGGKRKGSRRRRNFWGPQML